MKNSILLFVLTSMLFGVVQAQVWDFTQKQPDWDIVSNMRVQQTEEGLLLDIFGYDSYIGNKKADIDPKKYQCIRITYKALELPEGTTKGEFFFAGNTKPNYVHSFYFHIPSLKKDGKWNVITLNLADEPRLQSAWVDNGNLDKFRLDMLNQFPAKILLKSVELLPPLPPMIVGIQDTTAPQGFFFPKDYFFDGEAKVRLNAGRYALWFRGVAKDNFAWDECIRVRNAPFTRNVKHVSSLWHCLGFVEAGGDSPVVLEISSDGLEAMSGLVLTTFSGDVQDRDHRIPLEVVPDLKEPLKPVSTLLFDKHAPYWGGKMVAVRGCEELEGTSFVRKDFVVEDLPSKALLQVVADDSIRQVWLNGNPLPIDGEWSTSWKEPSSVDVTKLLAKGDNILAVEYNNGGSVGGVLLDLQMMLEDGRVQRVVSDESCRGTYGTPVPGWQGGAVKLESLKAVSAVPGPPATPWTVVLPYIRLMPASVDSRVVGIRPSARSTPRNPSWDVTFQGEPRIVEGDIAFAHIVNENGGLVALKSGSVSGFSPSFGDGGQVTLTFGDFELPPLGYDLSLKLIVGLHNRKFAAYDPVDFTLPRETISEPPVPLRSVRVEDAGNGPRVLVNDKAFYPIFLSIFYDREETGLEGADSPVNVREFLAGGASNTWWIAPRKYDFTEIDNRIAKIIREYPNAYVAAWIWLCPPPWYAKAYPDRISRNNDGTRFDYYTATVTFSDPDYREDAKHAIDAFVKHCESLYSSRMIAYNLCGGVSLEWQGWGCHGLHAKKALADYSPSAKRDFLDYVAKRYPELKVSDLPSYEQRFSSTDTIFRDPVKDLVARIHDEFYSQSIADTICLLAQSAKGAMAANPKLVGCYYGYSFEYGNMSWCVNSSGHNAAATVVRSPHVDFLLSPPSYAIRAIGNTGGEMKPFGSIHHNGKFSMIEDDTRTNNTKATNYNQTINPDQTRQVTRRNWGMALAQKTPICHLPIVQGSDFGSPETRRDLAAVRQVGQEIFESDRQRGAQIAVVVDEKAWKNLEPVSTFDVNPRRRHYLYSHSGVATPSNQRGLRLTGNLTSLQRAELIRCGAATDWILMEDVPKLAGKYKLFIFLNAFEDSPAARLAFDAVKKNANGILVVYGAGFVGSDTVPDLAGMSRLLGMNVKLAQPGPLAIRIDDLSPQAFSRINETVFGTDASMDPRFAIDDTGAKALGRYVDCDEVALASKQLGMCKMTFCGSNALTPDLIAAIALDAGVHIYSYSNDPLFVGCGTLTIHTRTAGKKQFLFPESTDVVDMFTKQVLAKGVTEFSIDIPAFETRNFLLRQGAR
jgi:hypothetical protein